MIYENVRHFAEKRNISITELEIKSGLQNGTIGKWRNSCPKADNLKKVADVLNVKVDTLMKGI